MLWQKSWWETRWGLLAFMGAVLLFAAFHQPWKQADLAQWISSLQERAPRWSENSRRKVLLTHAALVAVEMLLIAFVPSLMVPLTSRLTGGWFPFGSAVVYALLLSLGGMVFLAFSFLLMIIFNNQLIVLAIGVLTTFATVLILRPMELQATFDEFPSWHIYHVTSGETCFRYGQIPWFGLLASLGASALMMLVAVRIYERRDF